jgi:ferric-dicitrate binding protein FerR (iron transport regulator)
MAFPEKYIARLLLKKTTGELSAEESADLEAWRLSSPANRRKYDELTGRGSLQQKIKAFMEADVRAGQMRFGDQPAAVYNNVHRAYFLRKWGWAAAVILLIGAAVYIGTKKTTSHLADAGNPAPLNIPPGGSKAILTLADGSAIILDSAANGRLAIQGNTRIVKDANGKISYGPGGASTPTGRYGQTTAMNTLSTPMGGQYQLTLPDGTHVWLNAASSITFPIAFTGKQRRVEVTGEVYFEVTGNKLQPFVVDVKDKQSVEVLGTRFNINSYRDEANVQTTLAEGSIKVTGGKKGPVAILRPGQQAVVSSPDQPVKVVDHNDLRKILAWKDGLFDFNGADVPSVMRQLARWYDIRIKYEGVIPSIHFKGGLDRNVNLSEILKILPELGIRYRMEDRTLIVL